MKPYHRTLTALVCISAIAVGCVGPRSTSPAASQPIPRSRTIDSHTAKKELDVAKEMIAAGDTSVVIPRLIHLITKYPESKTAVEARYVLGLAYREVKSFRSAMDMFEEYLRLDPEGASAENARTQLADLANEYARQYTSPEELDQQIASATDRLNQAPGDLAARLELADLLWQRGNYNESAQMYHEIATDHPEYAHDGTLASRVELLPSGGYVVLSPAEVQRREIEAQPLTIENQASFRAGRDIFTRVQDNYVVTGQAFNRSDSVLYGVQVHVTLYGFGGMVFDASTVNVGRLSPGERRAFSVRFANFDNIENIQRFECVGSFQK